MQRRSAVKTFHNRAALCLPCWNFPRPRLSWARFCRPAPSRGAVSAPMDVHFRHGNSVTREGQGDQTQPFRASAAGLRERLEALYFRTRNNSFETGGGCDHSSAPDLVPSDPSSSIGGLLYRGTSASRLLRGPKRERTSAPGPDILCAKSKTLQPAFQGCERPQTPCTHLTAASRPQPASPRSGLV